MEEREPQKALIQTLENMRTQMNMDYDQWSQGDRSDSRTAARLGSYADRLSTALGLADAADAEIARLTAEHDSVGTNGEMATAQLRGWADFFSGQPRDMPYQEPGTYAKNSQLNFAWCLGYDQARESELFVTMVGRADRSAEKSQALANALATAEAERDALSAQIAALVQEWREETETGTSWDDGYVSGLHHCADELSPLMGKPK